MKSDLHIAQILLSPIGSKMMLQTHINTSENKPRKCFSKLGSLIPIYKAVALPWTAVQHPSGHFIFQSILALSHNVFLAGMERTIANPRESIKGMIASHFHLKGNLLTFVSHKSFTSFLLLREISLYSARLTNSDTSAVLWVPGKAAMSKSHNCGLEEGPHQQHSQGLGRKQRSWKRSRSSNSSLISQQTPGRTMSNALKGKDCKNAITTSFSQARTKRTARLQHRWQTHEGETTAGRGSQTSASWKSTTQN